MTDRGTPRPSPPILFLPGAGGSPEFWRPVAEELRSCGEPVLLGWPGFGAVAADPSLRSLDDLYGWMCDHLPPGASHVVAQSMGGILAARLAIEQPERVASLVLVATSGGMDLSDLRAEDWRPAYLREHPDVPRWFVDDRTDLTARLGRVRAPTLLLWSDADPVSPLAVGERLAREISQARLEVISGGSHAFAHERPLVVASLIRHFLGA